MGTKKLQINWNDFDGAFEEGSYEQSYYLNLETGEVLFISEDDKDNAAMLADDDRESDEAIYAAIDQLGVEDWQRQSTYDAVIIEASEDKFLQIPEQNSHTDYGDMEQFIWSIEAEHPDLAATLEKDIRGQGAFRRFKSTIDDDPDIREQWFTFKDERRRERMQEWLKGEGIKVEFV